MTHLLVIGAPQIILILIVVLMLGILPLIALIDILRNEFTQNNKLIWTMVVIFFTFIGAILYFIMGSKHKIIDINKNE